MLSRSYPNEVTPVLGIWTEELVRHVAGLCDLRVISPVPYCPPLPGLRQYTRFRRVEARERRRGVEVWHPRFLTGPGYSFHNYEAETYYLGVRRLVARLRRDFPFELIHAFFSYPDGVAGARLAREYGVPLVITEHAPWHPWMEQYPRVRGQAIAASRQSALHITVSHYARATIARYAGESDRLRVLPNGVDEELFTPLPDGGRPRPGQILFVGLMRHVKGVDVLLRAMQRLAAERPDWRLVLVGGGFYQSSLRYTERMRALVGELGLEGRVEFVGMKAPGEVAAYMRESAVLVLPSRSETFGSVILEALACGTPVVATRCGGPEDVVTPEVGRLVPKEDPDALAAAIAETIEGRAWYDPRRLRRYAVEHFAWGRIAEQTVGLYAEALAPVAGGIRS